MSLTTTGARRRAARSILLINFGTYSIASGVLLISAWISAAYG